MLLVEDDRMIGEATVNSFMREICRAAICYLAVKEFNLSGVAVARALNMTRSGVSVAVKRGGEIVSVNPAIRGRLVD